MCCKDAFSMNFQKMQKITEYGVGHRGVATSMKNFHVEPAKQLYIRI